MMSVTMLNAHVQLVCLSVQNSLFDLVAKVAGRLPICPAYFLLTKVKGCVFMSGTHYFQHIIMIQHAIMLNTNLVKENSEAKLLLLISM